jgi:hypothetical protein
VYPCLEVVDGELVVDVGVHMGADVDYDRGTDEVGRVELVGAQLALVAGQAV